jgi:hypothetical protein
VVIASSFGAFLALHALALREQSGARVEIEALVLLAPVVDPWHHGSMLLSEQVEQQWRAQGSLPIVDLERQCTVPVHYQFVEELQALGACRAPLKVPTLIVHGRSDPVVSVEQSRLFAVSQSRVTLVTVEGDHSLLENPNDLVGLIEDFIGRVELLQNE